MPTIADLLPATEIERLKGGMLAEQATLKGATTRTNLVACSGGCGMQVHATTKMRERGGEIMCSTCSTATSAGKSATPSTNRATPMGVVVNRRPVSVAMSDAQLGAAVKDAVREEIAADLPAKREAAVSKKRKGEKADRKAKRKAREEIAAIGVLPEFTLAGRFVPAFDVTEVESLDEAPSPKMCSAYNKALHTSGQDLLPKAEPGIGQEVCTYRLLVETHRRLLVQSGIEALAALDVLDEIDPAKALRKRQIKGLRELIGCTKADAKRILDGN